MNETTNAPETRPLASRSIAAVNLVAHWQAADVQHEDRLHFERFSVWRDGDALPMAWFGKLNGLVAGDTLQSQHPAGELVPAFNAKLRGEMPVSGFDTRFLSGREVQPAAGRFYPRGFCHGHLGVLREEWEPARIVGMAEDTITLDLNHPMARIPVDVRFELLHVHDEVEQRGGRCNNCIEDLLFNTGMKVDLIDAVATDYWANEGASRLDPRPDDVFYTITRMVPHLDATARSVIADLYARLIPANARVLDLMGSWESHLDRAAPQQLDVLGMNAEELDANSKATGRHVQDLNSNPTLPFADASLDAIVCTASVEYLTSPDAVFAEAHRVLRPGGTFICSFSNRWFPTKAVRVWSELHEFERPGLVTSLFRKAGFGELHTFSQRGLPRPPDDPHAHETRLADPVHAVWGIKP